MSEQTEQQIVEVTASELRCLLDMLMCSDPFPSDDCISFFDRASVAFGFENWVVAFHRLGKVGQS